MMILIHSSKTMRAPMSGTKPTGTPVLRDRAEELIAYLRTLTPRQLAQIDLFNAADRRYAHRHVRILSGLYGILRPFDGIPEFGEIGYRYHKALSAPGEPAFVCREFDGKGLSVRLT